MTIIIQFIIIHNILFKTRLDSLIKFDGKLPKALSATKSGLNKSSVSTLK